ncbi:NADH:quinone oxidoreductase I, chain G (cl35703 superfamily) [Campylobacter corcagiensis]|uniref:NADH-quinone oxidoreductase subunit G n=1 Tax=Campylobacter corcagiensis TaxID=1448857 RepID=A0A7M1LGT0_9BACT|nr:NADH-quinone oxidoreductase subunit G [Campylobacter corcagiensis]QKF64000.1 NADH:quinone oxidoreductase I, chain G (cl35703 superfamily) [Campylobacter corcagiensis]QOQ87797.1 NADH-quinone oxidoreductase subunit G [Campylobacter corcagiensis]
MIWIDGKAINCDESESILNVARKNGIYIPAICYLSGCSPTLACRLCMVEADGKVVYSCNAKAKDGLKITTNSPELNEARKAIMQTYCVNHPLECGVCDQSGECELQNMVFHMKVSEVPYAIKDSYKPVQKWGIVEYEPALCIVCERCVTVCKDKIGENRLKTVPRNADQLPKEYKDELPKDAYAVWNKFQKSLIGLASGKDYLECSQCGECAAVCPVGALTESHFTYTTNAWELTKIPSSNPHASDCELIYYEIKPTSIEDRTPKIYRVSNDFFFGEIDKAARFGYDFNNGFGVKDEIKFKSIVENIKNGTIKNIKFSSFITNEEARILELLSKKYGLNLVNDEAKKYQEFLNIFSDYSGMTLYSGDVDSIKEADFIVVAGSFLRYDAPNLSYKVNNALKINKASGYYFHPIEDSVVEGYSKNFKTITHKPNLDIEILLFILQKFGTNLPVWIADKLVYDEKEIKDLKEETTKMVEFSKFAEVLGVNEEEFDKLSKDKKTPVLIIGEDYIKSKNAPTLAKLLGYIQRFTSFKIIIIPPRTNSLGVAKICTISKPDTNKKTLGYNEKADFEFGVYEGLNAPSLNQQEGTFLNLDRRVVPINPALPYYGYELNDIAKALGLDAKHTIDYSENLGDEFKSVKFDDLENFYDNGGKNHRGYKLEPKKIVGVIDSEFDIENKALNLDSFIYLANPISQFSKFTARSSIGEVAYLYAGAKFLKDHGLEDKDIVEINGISLGVKLDSEIEGAYLPYFDDKIEVEKFFKTRYENLEIKRLKDE